MSLAKRHEMIKKKKKVQIQSNFTSPSQKQGKGDFGESLTDLTQARDTDVHRILKRFETDKVLTTVGQKPAFYDDVSDVISYQDAMNRVAAVHTTFNELPSKIRAKFNNSPEEFIEFMSDPEGNYEEGVKLGLFEQVDLPAADADELPSTPETPEKAKPEAPAE